MKSEKKTYACIGNGHADESKSNKKQLERNINITRKIIDGDQITLVAAANNISKTRCYEIFKRTLRDAYYKENNKELYTWNISVSNIKKDAHEWQKLIGKLV